MQYTNQAGFWGSCRSCKPGWIADKAKLKNNELLCKVVTKEQCDKDCMEKGKGFGADMVCANPKKLEEGSCYVI